QHPPIRQQRCERLGQLSALDRPARPYQQPPEEPLVDLPPDAGRCRFVLPPTVRCCRQRLVQRGLELVQGCLVASLRWRRRSGVLRPSPRGLRRRIVEKMTERVQEDGKGAGDGW